MRFPRSSFPVLLVLAFALPARSGPIEFRALESRSLPTLDPRNKWLVHDVDGDGTDELAVIIDERTLLLRSMEDGEWVVRRQHYLNARTGIFTNYMAICADGDRDQDGLTDLVFSRLKGDTIAVDVWDGSGARPLLSFHAPDVNGDERMDTARRPAGWMNSGEPGEGAILIAAASGYDRTGRGILAFSPDTGEELWRFEMGANPSPLRFRLEDLDGRPGEELLFTTGAPANGLDENGVDDAHCWMIALRYGGDPLWKRRIGGSYCFVPDVEVVRPGGAGPFVVTCVRHKGGAIEQGGILLDDSLQVWDGATGEPIWERDWGGRINGFALLDDERFVVSGGEGEMVLFEISKAGEARAVREASHLPALRLHRAADLDRDGRAEILGERWEKGIDCALVALDGRLDVVGEQSFDVKGGIERIELVRRGDRPPAILIGMTDYRFTLEPVPVGEPWWETGAGRTGLIAAVAILLSLVLWLIVRWRRRKGKNGKVPPEPTRAEPTPERIEALYLALKTTGHGKLAVLGSLARLIGFLRNAEALGGWNERTRERMALNVLTLRRSGVPRIREIADQVRAMRLDDGLEERLREGVAALDGALALLDETKRGAEEPRVPLGKLVRAEELLGGEDGALPALRWRLVRDYLTLPLRGEVELVFDSLRENLEEAGIALDRPAPEKIAAIRVEAFAGDAAFVLENLIGNAIRAMESSGRKELRVAVRADEEDVYIEVADTGAGIPEEDWERIFEPGYTTRGSGGGHGLGESREKLRRVGGSIRVARSAPGEGTVFAVRLKRIGNGKGGPE